MSFENNNKKSPYREFYGTANLYEIQPSYWDKSWGLKPVFGYVRADNPYFARYAAFDKGLVPLNSTFEPKPVLVVGKVEKTDKAVYKKPIYRRTKNESSI